MAAPALKDLPKVAVDLKSQLESFSPNSLKNAETEEKFVLPTAEGKDPYSHLFFKFMWYIVTKNYNPLIIIELVGLVDMKQERHHMSMLQGLENFDTTKLKPTNTTEKSILPSIEGSCLVLINALILS